MIKTKNREIKTILPNPSTYSLMESLFRYEPESMLHTLPIIWKKAKNFNVWDEFGNKFIDLTSTIFVTNAGHGATEDAIIKQVKELMHCYTFPSMARIKFIEKLMRILPPFCEKIFLASAGSEATHWAVNLMREYTGKHMIMHFEGAFHGKVGDAAFVDTSGMERGSISITRELWDDEFEAYLERNVGGIAGLMVETYEGWSAKFHDKEFIQKLVQWCKSKDIPVCFDEIQSGFYRTGRLFGYEHYDVEPDLICMGKGLGNGLPISGLSGRAKYFNVEGMSSTHSANPLCCAGALATIEVLQSIDQASLRSNEHFLRAWAHSIRSGYTIVDSANTKGLLGAIIFKSTDIADRICELAMREGVLVVKTGKPSIKIAPPLTITKDALEEAILVLTRCIVRVQEEVDYVGKKHQA